MNNIISFMQDVKRVEIIISDSHLQDALKILDNIGVSGYTIINDTSGKGDRGLSCSDDNCVYHGTYILTVCTNEKQLFNLTETLKPLLNKVGGICLVNEAKWIHH
ncbi:transcriptional regulator [Crocosphaera sp. UHCC 0190]|uniref:P-II family nitrogen regulator n=1 Tax=Crocosphaera sp. UHCC 0190 TaxID=3110246 RepID=UPI002B1F6BCE|nr:transcriptional regulator [Crocosphaera sp. UHCC 0190]MEA5509465.1 transcriptional regulator [Crocosphaera sp. UHCC 0190]